MRAHTGSEVEVGGCARAQEAGRQGGERRLTLFGVAMWGNAFLCRGRWRHSRWIHEQAGEFGTRHRGSVLCAGAGSLLVVMLVSTWWWCPVITLGAPKWWKLMEYKSASSLCQPKKERHMPKYVMGVVTPARHSHRHAHMCACT